MRRRNTIAANSGHGDPPVRGLGLRTVLAYRTLAVTLDDSASHNDDHPSRAVLDVASAERQPLACAHGGPQQHLDDVANLPVELRATPAGLGSPALRGRSDCRALLERQSLRLALGMTQRRRAYYGIPRDRIVPQSEPEKQVEQGPRLVVARGGDGGLRLEEPLDPASGDLRERVLLERGKDVEANLVAVVLLGSFGEGLDLEVGQPHVRQVCEGALRREDPGAAERGPIQQPYP